MKRTNIKVQVQVENSGGSPTFRWICPNLNLAQYVCCSSYKVCKEHCRKHLRKEGYEPVGFYKYTYHVMLNRVLSVYDKECDGACVCGVKKNQLG